MGGTLGRGVRRRDASAQKSVFYGICGMEMQLK